MQQPYCRACGKKIRKRTVTIYFVPELRPYHVRENEVSTWVRYLVGHPLNKAEAQRLVNQPIVSVRHSAYPWAHNPKDVYVSQASTWDEASYVDAYFCSGACANTFAYAMARQTGYALPAYREAIINATEGIKANG